MVMRTTANDLFETLAWGSLTGRLRPEEDTFAGGITIASRSGNSWVSDGIAIMSGHCRTSDVGLTWCSGEGFGDPDHCWSVETEPDNGNDDKFRIRT